MLDFKLLGPIEVREEHSRTMALRGPKIRQVIALLALNAEKVVPVDQFIDELWDTRIPKDALKTLQTHIYYLRRMLGPRAGLVATRARGYALHVERERVDALVFSGAVQEAERRHRAGAHAAAAALLGTALELWTGPALADVRRGAVLAPHVIALEEQRIRALELHMDARISQGMHGELIEELRMLVAAHPLNENFHSQLITALARAGRRTDAHRAYEGLRALLDAELGVEPAFDIHALH